MNKDENPVKEDPTYFSLRAAREEAERRRKERPSALITAGQQPEVW